MGCGASEPKEESLSWSMSSGLYRKTQDCMRTAQPISEVHRSSTSPLTLRLPLFAEPKPAGTHTASPSEVLSRFHTKTTTEAAPVGCSDEATDEGVPRPTGRRGIPTSFHPARHPSVPASPRSRTVSQSDTGRQSSIAPITTAQREHSKDRSVAVTEAALQPIMHKIGPPLLLDGPQQTNFHYRRATNPIQPLQIPHAPHHHRETSSNKSSGSTGSGKYQPKELMPYVFPVTDMVRRVRQSIENMDSSMED